MKNRYKALIFVSLAAVLTTIVFFARSHLLLFLPRGTIARGERNLMIAQTLLMLIVVIPVYTLLFIFARRYGADGYRGEFDPDPPRNRRAEFVWWAAPAAVVVVMSVITWKTTHALDPYRPLESDVKPLTIQVVALDWKWLFIYPEQKIAAVNFVQFPARTPVNFELTADAPMNSFWIPQLSGQIYAMPGMSTRLHIVADASGEFAGRAAEINGEGLAGMTFVAKASSASDFDKWVQAVKNSPDALDLAAYDKLAEPSKSNPAAFYSSAADNLYARIIMKFLMPSSAGAGSSAGPPDLTISGTKI